MNEQDLKEMIRSLLSEMDTDTVTELKKEEQTQNSEFKSLEKNGVQPDKEETTIEDGIIPDITEVDIQEQLTKKLIVKLKNSHQLVWDCGEQETVIRLRQFFVSVQTMLQLKMRCSHMFQMILLKKWDSFLFKQKHQRKMNT